MWGATERGIADRGGRRDMGRIGVRSVMLLGQEELVRTGGGMERIGGEGDGLEGGKR